MIAATLLAAVLLFYCRGEPAKRLLRTPLHVAIETAPSTRLENSFGSATVEAREQARFEQLFAQVLAAFVDDSDPMASEQRATAFQTLVDGLGLKDFAPAVRAIAAIESANPTQHGRELALRVMQRWSEEDSPGAATAAAELPADERIEACERIGAAWARNDPEAATAWAGTLSNGSESQSALFAIASNEVFANPARALTMLSQMPASNQRDNLIERAVSTWSEIASADTLQWAGQIPESTLRERIIGTIATTLAGQAPDAAAHLVLEEMSAGPEQENTILAIIQRWAPIDKAAALAWVDKFPPGDLRDRASSALRRNERVASSE